MRSVSKISVKLAFATGGVVASEPVESSERYRFGEDFELDLESYTLCQAGRALKLERIPMEILLFFVEQRGRLVTREQIVEKIWGRSVFLDTDNSINGAIRKIRQVLKDDSEKPRYIETVTGKGYRFIARVETGAESSGETDDEPPARGGDSLPAVAGSFATRTMYRRWFVLAGAVAVLLGIVVAGVWWSHAPARLDATGAKPMLAVLPFTNMTGDPAQEYFSDGLTEEMISQLGNLDPRHLGVIARTSVMHYKNSQAPLSQVGRELGVQYVIEGSVRRDSERVRIAAKLIQVSDQSHVWARQYDRPLRDLLAVQSEIAQEVADEIQMTLLGQNSRNAAKRPANIPAATPYEAYDLYLKGRYFWNKRTEAGFRQAADYFQQAVDKDPNYARAYAGLADTFALMSTWFVVPQNEFMPKARTAALRALELDGDLAEAHASLGLVAESYDYDWSEAEKEFRRAIELNPQYATAHQWYAEYLAWQGRFDEAIAESEQARQLDPMSLIIASDHATILYYSRQYDRAIEQGHAVLDMDPTFSHVLGVIVGSYVQERKFSEALDEINRLRSADDQPLIWGLKAFVYGRWGRSEDAREALAKFEQVWPRSPVDRIAAAPYAYLGTEPNEKVLRLLEQAYSEHSNAVVRLKVDPMYDSARDEPEFQRLLARMGLSR